MPMPTIGIVGTIGGWSSETLADTVAEVTGRRILIDLKRIRLDLETGRAMHNGIDLSTLDALIIKKVGARYSADLIDRLEILRFLNERGLPMFSAPLPIMRVLDRLSCTVTLRLGGIPMPETTITEDPEAALSAVEAYGEAVFKPLYTSKARGMEVISAGPEARDRIAAYAQNNSILYIQKKIPLPERDLGIAFLGGEYLTTYARCKNGDSWNTTTRSGGKYLSAEPAPSTIELARKAQALFDLHFTCVDVAETPDGPLVFEVSAFGGFRGITSTSGIDPARRLVDYVIDRITP